MQNTKLVGETKLALLIIEHLAHRAKNKGPIHGMIFYGQFWLVDDSNPFYQ